MLSWHRIRKLSNHPLAPVGYLFIIILLFLLPLFKNGIFDTHDGQLHIARIAQYSKAVADGQFPVRWASDLNFGYGSPVFIFYYPLPYIAGTILHALGLTYIDSFKALLGLVFIIAPISFYFWLKKLFPPAVAASSALIFALAPYHFLDLYVRGAIGELFAFVFIPLVFLAIELIASLEFKRGILTGALAYASLILSHNAFALLFTPAFILYALIRLRSGKQRIIAAVFLLLALGISAYFWLPAIFEQRYTHSDLFVSSTYKQNFPNFAQLIWSPWGFGKNVTKPDGLSPQIGPFLIFCALGGLVFTKKHSKYRWLFIFGTVLFAGGIFFSLSASQFFWDQIQILRNFEFPWRMTGLTSFAAAVLSAPLFFYVKRNVTLLILSGFLLSSILYASTQAITFYPDNYYDSYSHSTDFGAASTIWSAGDPTEFPKQPIEVIGGIATVTHFQKEPTIHTFRVRAETPSTILDNTLYYPGWRAFLDRVEVPIQFQDPSHRGLITLQVPKGTSVVRVVFEETRLRKLADIISILTASIFLILVLYV